MGRVEAMDLWMSPEGCEEEMEEGVSYLQLGRFAGGLSSSVIKSLSVEKLLGSSCLGNPTLRQATGKKDAMIDLTEAHLANYIAISSGSSGNLSLYSLDIFNR